MSKLYKFQDLPIGSLWDHDDDEAMKGFVFMKISNTRFYNTVYTFYPRGYEGSQMQVASEDFNREVRRVMLKWNDDTKEAEIVEYKEEKAKLTGVSEVLL